MLDQEGWLHWWKAAIPDLITKVDTHHYNKLECITEGRWEYQGVIINLSTNWREINISLWLAYSILIYYTWGLEEWLENRWCKLNLKLIVASEASDDGGVDIHDIDCSNAK
jgi:hypothetical protein